VASQFWNGETDQLPLHSENAPWNDLVSLRESRGEKTFLRKMTKALKKNLTRLDKKARQEWLSGAGNIKPWEELSAGDEALQDFWWQNNQNPDTDEAVAAFQAWQESRETADAFSVWETWHLLSSLVLNGSKLPDSLFWQVWNLAAEAFQQLRPNLDPPDGAEGELDQFLITAVELRWLAFSVFPEIEQADKLPKRARRSLSDWLEGFFPLAGIPDAEDLERLPYLWRSLARCATLCDQSAQKLFRKSDHKELRRLLLTTCRLAGESGRLLIIDDSLPWNFLRKLGEKVATKKQSGLIELLKTYEKQSTSGKAKSRKKRFSLKEKAAQQIDECAWAILRTGWSPASDRCSVLHQNDELELVLQSGCSEFLKGLWTVEIVQNGESCFPREDWEVTELEQQHENDILVNRQLFLSRRDHFLYLAEIVNASEEDQLQVRSTIPVSNQSSTKQDKYTREWQLLQKKRISGRLFPVSYDQEIVQKTDGSIQQTSEGLTFTKPSTGSLYLPLIIDWHPHHLAAPAEWRKLTITQNRQKTPSREAGAYRLRLAEQHLFMYRSIQKPHTPRAILGEHTLNESLIGNFDSDGDVLPLLVVEE